MPKKTITSIALIIIAVTIHSVVFLSGTNASGPLAFGMLLPGIFIATIVGLIIALIISLLSKDRSRTKFFLTFAIIFLLTILMTSLGSVENQSEYNQKTNSGI